ncbi:PfkB family carbohydrate kinase [Nonomuraea ferruginea]
MLHVTGVTAALGRDPHDAVLAAVSAAKSAEVPISFAVEYRPELWASVREAEEVLTELACQSHLLFVRQDELDLIKPALTPEREVVVARGAKGASVRADRMRYDAPGPQTPVVDYGGAGDAFVAGYLSAALDGLTPPERLRRATQLSAAAASTASDWQGPAEPGASCSYSMFRVNVEVVFLMFCALSAKRRPRNVAEPTAGPWPCSGSSLTQMPKPDLAS